MSKENRLIGISGKKGSGKDEVGKIIQFLTSEDDFKNYNDFKKNNTRPSFYAIKSFATKLKQHICLSTGCTMEQLEDGDFKESYLGKEWVLDFEECKDMNAFDKFKYSHLLDEKMTYRDLLQMVGNSFRDINPNIWVNSLFCDYNDSSSWIITDVRFPNEFVSVRDRGGLNIRIERKTKSVDNDITETALDSYGKFDYVIKNNSSLPKLVEKVREILIKEEIIL